MDDISMWWFLLPGSIVVVLAALWLLEVIVSIIEHYKK